MSQLNTWRKRHEKLSRFHIFFRPWSDLLKRVAGAPRGADRGRSKEKSRPNHPLGATGNMPTRSSAVFWAQEGVHPCHLDRNTGDHGENPLKNIDFGVRRLLFSRGARPLFFEGRGHFFERKKKSLFSRKNVRRLLCWYSGCAGAMQQVQNKKKFSRPPREVPRALVPPYLANFRASRGASRGGPGPKNPKKNFSSKTPQNHLKMVF